MPAEAQQPALRGHAVMTVAPLDRDPESAAWKTGLIGRLALAVRRLPPSVPLATPGSVSRLAGPWSSAPDALRDSIVVSLARTAVGTRYVRGGQSRRSGFDCSGLVRHIMTSLEVDVPRTSRDQATSGVAVARDTAQLRPGDLLAFAVATRRISHVGVYIGDGRYVHASSVAGQVIESRLDRPRSSLVKGWRGARRILPRSESTERATE